MNKCKVIGLETNTGTLKANPDNSNLIGLRIFDSTNLLHLVGNERYFDTHVNNNNYYNTAHCADYPLVHAWAGTRAYFSAMTSGNLA